MRVGCGSIQPSILPESRTIFFPRITGALEVTVGAGNLIARGQKNAIAETSKTISSPSNGTYYLYIEADMSDIDGGTPTWNWSALDTWPAGTDSLFRLVVCEVTVDSSEITAMTRRYFGGDIYVPGF